MKTCIDCGTDITGVNQVKSGRGIKSRCRTCHNATRRANHDPVKSRAEGLKSRYNLTLDQYDDMYEDQEGRCAICGTDTPGSRFKHFHVDHDHVTGQVRALLCEACNTGLGKFKDDPSLLRSAALYLEKHDRNSSSPSEEF
jgi:hypothetical protein